MRSKKKIILKILILIGFFIVMELAEALISLGLVWSLSKLMALPFKYEAVIALWLVLSVCFTRADITL